MAKQERKLWVLLASFTAAVAFGLGCLYVHAQSSIVSSLQQPSRSMNLSTKSPPSSKDSQQTQESFSDAMARMDTVFRARSEVKTRELIAKANAGAAPGSARPCPFEWRNGEAALSLQTDLHGELRLTQTINACVDSIEQLP